MPHIFAGNFLSRGPIEKAMRDFSRKFDKEKKVLDIGCGNKPYAKFFSCEYIGLDPFKETKADLVADAWNIPAQDNEYDGVILNQSLEHIEKTEETINEVRRVLKPGGICIVTVPQTMKNHSGVNSSSICKLENFDKNKHKYWQVDFYRFTKFGLIYLFRDFKIIDLYETSGYFGTISQLINYFFCSLQPLSKILFPVYFIFNIIGIFFDTFFLLLSKLGGIFKKFYVIIYLSLTLNYILIIKKND